MTVDRWVSRYLSIVHRSPISAAAEGIIVWALVLLAAWKTT